MLIHFFCLKAGNVSLQNFVCSVDLHMQETSANTELPKAKFSRRDSEFGLLRLKIPHNDSLFFSVPPQRTWSLCRPFRGF